MVKSRKDVLAAAQAREDATCALVEAQAKLEQVRAGACLHVAVEVHL